MSIKVLKYNLKISHLLILKFTNVVSDFQSLMF